MLSTPDEKTTIKYSMIGFVDDSSTQVNDFNNKNQDNIDDLIKHMQQDFQQWSDMFHFTGGSLNFKKYSYHITHYKFTTTCKPYLTQLYTTQTKTITIQENNKQQNI